MNKELQNHVWKHCLPKEFKEEVKIYYQYAYVQYGKSDLYRGSANAIESLFGIHNLTSDVEGEDEMLTVEKSKVQRAYNTSREIVKAENTDSLMYSMHTQIMCVLENIFGSKCLPDDGDELSPEPKPAEPTCTNDCPSKCPSPGKEVSKDSANCDKQFDTIIKDGFHDHNRLHIAAMAMAGLLANPNIVEKSVINCQHIQIADAALVFADALISELNKKKDGK